MVKKKGINMWFINSNKQPNIPV